jgi:predicted transposase/invertase (TIGR01784 family)
MRLKEKSERDFNTAIGLAEIKGKAEGKLEGAKEMARRLLSAGVSVDVIADSSGLSVKEIQSLMH